MHYSSKIYKPILYTLLATSLTGCPPNQALRFSQKNQTSKNNSICPAKSVSLNTKMMGSVWKYLTPEGQKIIKKWNNKDINSKNDVGVPLLHKLVAGEIANKEAIPTMVSCTHFRTSK
ncbi:MAG: hypothetical protein K2X94_01725 [Amoebophilaceae bacterium]|nr:hypothetical protein [Amoebophilaceae bacterium]